MFGVLLDDEMSETGTRHATQEGRAAAATERTAAIHVTANAARE